MAQILVNPTLLRGPDVKPFISRLDELREHHEELSICRNLFEIIEREQLSYHMFAAFIPWCRSLETVNSCINYPSSRLVRKLGIKRFGKELSDPKKWLEAWESIGGTEGLIDQLARISVDEVKAFARVIGQCRIQHKIPAREGAIEELLRALIPSHYPGSRLQSSDKRSVQKHYRHMVAACSSDFVTRLLDSQDATNPLYRDLHDNRLLKNHGELLQKRVLDAVFAGGIRDADFHVYLQAFCYSQAVGPRPAPHVSAPMAFSMKVLKMRLGDSKIIYWPHQVPEAKVFENLLRRCKQKHLPGEQIREVLAVGLKLLAAVPHLKVPLQQTYLWIEVSTRWGKSPHDYQDLFTQAIRLDLAGSKTSICDNVLRDSSRLELDAQRTWDLLRLYCLHVPTESGTNVDLDIVTAIEPLGKQQWSSELFYKLDKDKAIRLLKSLQTSFPQERFLQGPRETSILSGSYTDHQRTALLLLIILQRESVEVQEKAKTTVDELRKQAATSREQADRAKFAIAATQYSIASGSLELYGETIAWSQRFVRDPVTSKEIFGRTAVMTIEGIELLSGIPNPLPEHMALEQVSSRVEKANAILSIFHEIMLTAMKEPSFQQYNWNHVCSLFGAAIKKRASNAKAVQERLLGSETDMYTAIWGNTLAMLEVIDVKFLEEANAPILELLKTLPLTPLAATAKSMLATGTERRKKERQPSDDLLENLSYAILLRLAKSDKPELARQLILQTILDRPDASSWHRRFLSPSFMKALTAQQAQEMLLEFATAIGEKLEEQSYVKVGEKQPAPSAPPQSSVKITTVKYLAQLLDNAEFISTGAAIEVLLELFKAGTHRDIRLATLESLLGLLNALCSTSDDSWRANPLVEKIMQALEAAVPIIGSINERRPPRAEEWEELQSKGKLPDVSDTNIDRLPPLMSAVVLASSGRSYPGLVKLQAEFVSRLILPIYHRSRKEQDKWTARFLAKHKANLKASELPSVPVAAHLWKILLMYYSNLLPQSVLEDYNKHIIMCISPPDALTELNELLKKDPELADTLEVSHWLTLFSENLEASDGYASSGTYILVRMIYKDRPQSLVPNGIAYDRVREMIISHALLFIENYEIRPVIWTDFVKSLRHPCQSTVKYESNEEIRTSAKAWQSTGRLILERVLELVEYQKELLAQQGEIRVVPSYKILSHWLLPFPSFPPQDQLEDQCYVFASELEKQLVETLDGGANLLRWPQIAEDACTVSKLLNTTEERLLVASRIGKLVPGNDQESCALNFVKMALAVQLIEDGKGRFSKWDKKESDDNETQVNLFTALRDVVQSWLQNADGSIREKALDWKRSNASIWQKISQGTDYGKNVVLGKRRSTKGSASIKQQALENRAKHFKHA